MKAQVHRRAVPKRDIRAAKQGSAREAIGKLERGMEVYCLTFGQFSLIEALMHIVEETGPAEVVLCTWTAADADLTTAARMVADSKITRMRVIVDRSFMTRPNAIGLAKSLRSLFGDECIRTTRSHAKFATIRNADWSIAVRTSMNLNSNPRLENIEISDDPSLCGFLEAIADDLFDEQKPGVLNADLPLLAGIGNIERDGAVASGKIEAVGERVSAPRLRSMGRASVGV